MTRIVGIRFHKAGKIYYFDPLDMELETAMHVIVETARGVEMGTVLIPPKEVEDDQVVQPLKPVIRVATDEDEKIIEKNKEREKEAFAICKEKIIKHGLEMKLVNAEYTFDNNKLLFYFTADGRIDFRELVKDLAAVFRTRIELRQIGVRDETKLIGGMGICGRELCCKSYLSDFIPVSIKMAKEQNLSLNPTKISGVCGRLMCCLKNEQETYEYLNSRLPSIGDIVNTPDGQRGEVTGISVLRQLIKVVVDNGSEKELREYAIDDLEFQTHTKRDIQVTEEEMKELAALEEEGTVEPQTSTEQKPKNQPQKRNNRKTNKNRNDKNDRYEKNDKYDKNNKNDNREKSNGRDKTEYREKNDNRDKNKSRNVKGDNTENGEKRDNKKSKFNRNRNRNRNKGNRNANKQQSDKE